MFQSSAQVTGVHISCDLIVLLCVASLVKATAEELHFLRRNPPHVYFPFYCLAKFHHERGTRRVSEPLRHGANPRELVQIQRIWTL
jgi:hypothetical protein